MTYPFLNFNGATIEVEERISNIIIYFTEYVITHPCWDGYIASSLSVDSGPL